jgi:hypothetical protein
MGHESKDIRLIASTVSEIENLVSYLLERKADGAKINVSLSRRIPCSSTLSNIYRYSMAYLLLLPMYLVLQLLLAY